MADNQGFFPIERNRYFYGKLLTVRDFEVEQNYSRRKSQLLSRLSLGAGVVCGLGVSASDDSTLLIESGMALDYQGRMIVIEEPLLRKLPMLEGHETLADADSAYLRLSYDETDMEPVNAVGANPGEQEQFNMTREGFKLTLTAQAPEFRGLLEAQGHANVCALYDSKELALVLTAPEAVCAGEEFTVEILIVKNERTPPVRFSLTGEGAFVDSEDGQVKLEYRESPEEKRRVYSAKFRLRARRLSDIDSPLFASGAELDLEVGSHHYKNYVDAEATCRLCRNRDQLERRQALTDSLSKHLLGQDVPIYLAKLELIRSAGSVFLSSVTNLPFKQRIRQEEAPVQDGGLQTVTASVRSLEYWQKPDVTPLFQPSAGTLHFDFGIPSPEQYDFAVSHGTVDLTMPGGLRVNSRVYSEEIPHGLGPGAVDVRLSVEFSDRKADGETALYFGNTEVFRGKAAPSAPPWVEAAALVYPSRGTMRIGLWLHDMVEGNRLTVHYFAQKPERDTSRLLKGRQVSLSVTPEFARVSRRGKLHFQAEVSGAEDKTVIWSVKEENGGAIDRNGLYQAPEQAGTYEILAVSAMDESVSASAFVIVE
ncbi:MAG: hypothetical protein IJK52_05385 [Oscillospiraceae bacterium]|nr:hypothetical protein [Oscillospiraceae bacterium]